MNDESSTGQSGTGLPAAGRPVSVDAAVPGGLASTQASAAATVASRSAAERIDTGALVPTFGIIGAAFLGALGRVSGQRATALDALAVRHASTSARATNAAASYDCCDDANAGALAAGVPA